MKMLILKTDTKLNYEQAQAVRDNIKMSIENGILVLDKRWNYEIVDFDDFKINED